MLREQPQIKRLTENNMTGLAHECCQKPLLCVCLGVCVVVGDCTEPACVYVAQKQDRFHCSRNPAPLLRASCVCVCLSSGLRSSSSPASPFWISCSGLQNVGQKHAVSSHTRACRQTHIAASANIKYTIRAVLAQSLSSARGSARRM